MLKIAKILSKGYSHIRIDLFDVDNNIYFGELTFLIIVDLILTIHMKQI